MEKIIEIDLKNKEDLFDRYNKNEISKDLIEYIINEITLYNKNDTYKIIINNSIKGQNKIENIIKEGLIREYNNNIDIYDQNNIRQLIFFIMGIIALFISVVANGIILKELASVGVWVLFWYIIEVELFEDKENRKRRKIIKKLLDSEFIENKVM
ncbi:MAG: hypothetical protein J6A17_00965 [Bacilli bacterium]|nr:hypothetical protein [Bacilli bacterium]